MFFGMEAEDSLYSFFLPPLRLVGAASGTSMMHMNIFGD
jgi:hypothetical protein